MLLNTYRFRPIIQRNHPDSVKKNLNFFKVGHSHPNASVCIQTYRNASKQVRMGPYGSEHVRKLEKSGENFEKIAKRDIHRGALLHQYHKSAYEKITRRSTVGEQSTRRLDKLLSAV